MLYRNDTFESIISIFVGHLYQIIPMVHYVIPYDITRGGVNFQVWYISVMLLGSIIVHYLYSYKREFTVNIFAPLIALSGWYYLVKNCSSFNNGDPIGPFFNGVYLRGITEMLCGVVLYHIILEVKKINFTKVSYICLRILEIFLAIALLHLVNEFGNGQNDMYFVLIICIIIIVSFIYPEKSDLINDSRLYFLNNLMYPVYLNHVFVLWVFESIPQGEILLSHLNIFIVTIGIFVCTCIYSLFTQSLLKFAIWLLHGVKRIFINC